MTNSAVDENGAWNYDRRLLAVGGLLLMAWGLTVWPLGFLPAPWFADTVLHFIFGCGLTLVLAATVPRRDDLLALTVAAIGVLWEPAEWWWFYCDTLPDTAGLLPRTAAFAAGEMGYGTGRCTLEWFSRWMTGHDTIKDIGYVWLGPLTTLVWIGRYR